MSRTQWVLVLRAAEVRLLLVSALLASIGVARPRVATKIHRTQREIQRCQILDGMASLIIFSNGHHLFGIGVLVSCQPR